ncbi:signal peptidase [Corynebacterium phocae]|uniref:Signal peptidase I n=1 Tax=Corynebacterium phocae TaxID=161895 RepID=A0A1L7D2E1_9CORY|nr:signal peptidase I [Corynebacterium phocae]APT92309.1 signal peptidase [Corynebacterium phocae]KAA8725344.1 signal peptidase I [Corynebacterium phocae]
MNRTSRRSKSRRNRSLVTRPAGVVAAAIVLIALFSALIGRAYVVPSGSMEPTFHGCAGCDNDRIMAQKLTYYFSAPQPGDVVVFAGPPAWNVGFESRRSTNVVVRGVQNLLAAAGLGASTENILTKRVIATGGQTVSCRAGDPAIMVDGQPLVEDYLLDPPETDADFPGSSRACGGEFFGPVQVPEDSLWVMGDNRTASADSRAHLGDIHQGTVPVDNVRGKVEFIISPPQRMGRVDHAQP